MERRKGFYLWEAKLQKRFLGWAAEYQSKDFQEQKFCEEQTWTETKLLVLVALPAFYSLWFASTLQHSNNISSHCKSKVKYGWIF